MPIPKKVKIVEVGPRDGLQNEPTPVPTNIKIEFINKLAATGLSVIEATAFVSPKWVPQMADHVQVLTGIQHHAHISNPVLVPNVKGLEAALAANVQEIALFIAASESFSQKNINCSIEESLQRCHEVILRATAKNVRVRAYISCVIACPYEGKINPKVSAVLAEKLINMGCYEISLGDTIGVGTPQQVQTLIRAVTERVPIERIAMHFHDTYGQALANIFASLECGITVIDSSVSGLGGCPYARGATGNVATEDVLYLLNGLNIETGVDLTKLISAGKFINDFLQRETQSKVARVMKI